MYTMEIQVLTEFQLKITMIGETISKKVISTEFGIYLELFGPNAVQNRKI